MKNIYKAILIPTTALLLSACSGNSNTPPNDNNDTNSTQTTTPPNDNNDTNSTPPSDSTAKGYGIVKCTGEHLGYDNATLINQDSKIESNTTNAKIRLWHTKDAKRACVVSGTVEKK